MRQRCTNPNNAKYRQYGGRGIKVCDRWMGADGFANFLNDMGNPPSLGYSLDRISPDGNYCPDNCRWASPNQQRVNQRDFRIGVKRIGVHQGSDHKWHADMVINKQKVLHEKFDNYDDALECRKRAEVKWFGKELE